MPRIFRNCPSLPCSHFGTRPLQGMLPRMEMLRGEALRYGGGTGAAGIPQPLRLKRFALSALPCDAPSRFAALFAERQQ